MTLRRERDNWFWVGYGKKAVAMATDCATRARKENRPDIAVHWDYWVRRCTADPNQELKVKLPQEFIEKYINRPTRFDGPPWWKDLERE